MAIRITIKDGETTFRSEGMAQAIHYALCSTGTVKVIINNGQTKEVKTYVDGIPTKKVVRAVA